MCLNYSFNGLTISISGLIIKCKESCINALRNIFYEISDKDVIPTNPPNADRLKNIIYATLLQVITCTDSIDKYTYPTPKCIGMQIVIYITNIPTLGHRPSYIRYYNKIGQLFLEGLFAMIMTVLFKKISSGKGYENTNIDTYTLSFKTYIEQLLLLIYTLLSYATDNDDDIYINKDIIDKIKGTPEFNLHGQIVNIIQEIFDSKESNDDNISVGIILRDMITRYEFLWKKLNMNITIDVWQRYFAKQVHETEYWKKKYILYNKDDPPCPKKFFNKDKYNSNITNLECSLALDIINNPKSYDNTVFDKIISNIRNTMNPINTMNSFGFSNLNNNNSLAPNFTSNNVGATMQQNNGLLLNPNTLQKPFGTGLNQNSIFPQSSVLFSNSQQASHNNFTPAFGSSYVGQSNNISPQNGMLINTNQASITPQPGMLLNTNQTQGFSNGINGTLFSQNSKFPINNFQGIGNNTTPMISTYTPNNVLQNTITPQYGLTASNGFNNTQQQFINQNQGLNGMNTMIQSNNHMNSNNMSVNFAPYRSIDNKVLYRDTPNNPVLKECDASNIVCFIPQGVEAYIVNNIIDGTPPCFFYNKDVDALVPLEFISYCINQTNNANTNNVKPVLPNMMGQNLS